MSGQGITHVVAGVIADARGRILLARRTAGRDLAGAWEFPGGKLEAGEAPLAALDRELHEELGIRVLAAEPLLCVPQQYPNKRIVLDVWRVTRFSGKPTGREKQALAWSPPDKLRTYPMPPADRPVVAALTEPDAYLVTPEPADDQRLFLRGIDKAIDAGIRRIQLRARTLPPDRLQSLAQQVWSRCRERDVEMLVNGDIELARRLSCGVHLRGAQLAALSARPLPVDLPVAASCHDVEELRRAEALDADFAVLGPVARTPTHKEREPIGWGGFALMREAVSLPIYALGGMKRSDLAMARRHGAQGIAAIRGFWPKA